MDKYFRALVCAVSNWGFNYDSLQSSLKFMTHSALILLIIQIAKNA